ncbi:outer membrane protein [Bartonella schoenbuchensis]|uniref:outer membrane protein n=1 Tax=Bartonella schoenbuchensis TaxID=165694 RepID=UPI003144DA12
MNMKCVITASIFALISASAAQAADMPVQERPVAVTSTVLPQVVVAPTFSWTGFYFGGQIGGFSSKSSSKGLYSKAHDDKELLTEAGKSFPKLSGFVGGLYAGSNVDLGNRFVLGVDTDIIWSGGKSKYSKSYENGQVFIEGGSGTSSKKFLQIGESAKTETYVSQLSLAFSDEWSGATRVRLGIGFDRVMPYVAGGIAYSQLKATVTHTKTTAKTDSGDDEAENTKEIVIPSLSGSKTLVGYTLGAGVDFAMTDSVMLRAEYRYSDFGKKTFVDDSIEVNHKTNDFRVGVAYKF